MKYKYYSIALLFVMCSCVNCYAISVSESATFLFSDTANRPSNINSNTVISTNEHGMYVVTGGSYYAGTNVSETIYAYSDGNDIKITFMSSGFTCTVIEMPDNSPLLSKADRPSNLNPQTALLLSNGDIWIIRAGSYYGSYYTGEDVVLYTMNDTNYLSFQHCGVSVAVDKLLDQIPLMVTSSRPGNVNPGTVLVLNNGQSWIVTSGSYYAGASTSEAVILYTINGETTLSYRHSGVSFVVDLLIETTSFYTLNAHISPLNSGLISSYGISCGSDCTESLRKGTYVTLKASPADKFLRWTGDCSGSEDICHINMTKNMDLTAIWHGDGNENIVPCIMLLLN